MAGEHRVDVTLYQTSACAVEISGDEEQLSDGGVGSQIRQFRTKNVMINIKVMAVQQRRHKSLSFTALIGYTSPRNSPQTKFVLRV